MNRTSNNRSGLFLLEIMIAILFFAMVSAVCLRSFARAHTLSQEASDMNQAMSHIENVAELLKSADNAVLDDSEQTVNPVSYTHLDVYKRQPLFCLSVYMNVSCITRYLSICIILIFSFFCCNCIFSLVLCFLVFLLFCLSFYLIISNRKNFFRPDICHIICRNISVYRCRLNCCSILICYLLYLISIFGSNFEAKTFSFCYFFCILIITIKMCIRDRRYSSLLHPHHPSLL